MTEASPLAILAYFVHQTKDRAITVFKSPGPIIPTIAMAKTVIERGYDVVYTPATAMLSDFEFQRFGNSTSGTVAEDTSRYFNCELLIIDDLGTEINNQFTTNCLYNIINARLNSGLPTVISTNLVSNELRNRYWDRITSRIFGEYKIMAFLGKDIRMQKMSGNK